MFFTVVRINLGEQLAHDPLHQHFSELVRRAGADGWILRHGTASQRTAPGDTARALPKRTLASRLRVTRGEIIRASK
jgi:hypothetical protein